MCIRDSLWTGPYCNSPAPLRNVRTCHRGLFAEPSAMYRRFRSDAPPFELVPPCRCPSLGEASARKWAI
eukprot:5561872-Pyramimonas_sp.AAC.1